MGPYLNNASTQSATDAQADGHHKYRQDPSPTKVFFEPLFLHLTKRPNAASRHRAFSHPCYAAAG
jgi:hypothetical protein